MIIEDDSFVSGLDKLTQLILELLLSCENFLIISRGYFDFAESLIARGFLDLIRKYLVFKLCLNCYYLLLSLLVSSIYYFIFYYSTVF